MIITNVNKIKPTTLISIVLNNRTLNSKSVPTLIGSLFKLRINSNIAKVIPLYAFENIKKIQSLKLILLSKIDNTNNPTNSLPIIINISMNVPNPPETIPETRTINSEIVVLYIYIY